MGGSRVAVVVGALALVLAGCGSDSRSIEPAGSCLPAVELDGTRYVPGDPDLTVRQGEPVAGAAYVGCGDGSARPRPVEAWRAVGYRGDGLVTLTLCATAAPGTADAVDCLPDGPRFDLWVLPTSSG